MQQTLQTTSFNSILMFLVTGSRNSLEQRTIEPERKKQDTFFKKLSRKKFLFLPVYSNSRIMALGIYINELLFDHNCVVVPGLGGFITRRVSAQVNPVSNKISPPGKKLAFNQALNLNDGILAKHIAGREDISYEKALEKTHTMLVELRQSLFENRTIHLEKVGSFYIDQDEVMTFHPEGDLNVSKEDFGLVTLSAVPVQRSADDKLKQKIRSRVDNRKPINKPVRARISRRSIIAVAATLFIGVAIVATQSLYNNKIINLGSIDLSKLLDIELPWNKSSIPAETKPTHLYKIDKSVASELKNITDQTISDNTYQLLAKGFTSISDARQFVDDLNAQKVDAKFSVKEKGLSWVSIATYTNKAEAEKHLVAIKSIFPEARLLEKRK